MKSRFLFLLLCFMSLCTFADDYQIKEISNASFIRINGKELRVNGTFSGSATIGWTAENQFIAVKNITRSESVRKFYRNQFAVRKAQSISDYLQKVARLDSRINGRSGLVWTDGRNKNKYAEKRIALVIGNSDYAYLKYLENAVPDASLVASKLGEYGFDVATCFDGNISDMKDALSKFTKRAVGYDIALFYYAGHGIQDSENNISYMLPLDIDIENDGKDYISERSCLSALEIRDRIQRAGCRANILLFDACRSNTIVRGFSTGLFSMEAGPKTLVMYSTANGETAMDRFGSNNNGPFAYAFTKCLEVPGLPLPLFIKNVQLEVKNITHNQQIPNPSGDNIEELFYLNGAVSNPTNSPSVNAEASKPNPVADQGNMVQQQKTSSIPASSSTTGFANGHEWVDLGLPSGTKWATMNVGANSPSDYGNYYAWGETKTKSSYTSENLRYCLDPKGNKYSKYVTNSKYGNVDGKKELDLSDDAAYVNWGSSWRMPNRLQIEELCEKCKWTWTRLEGNLGMMVVGPNGNSIFLPAAGDRVDTGHYNVSTGYYWVRSLDMNNCSNAQTIHFYDYSIYWSFPIGRHIGLNVRPVFAP